MSRMDFFSKIVVSSVLPASACRGGGGSGSAANYAVGGLTGSGLVLQNNGADDMSVAADGVFERSSYAEIHALAVQPDGRIVAARFA